MVDVEVEFDTPPTFAATATGTPIEPLAEATAEEVGGRFRGGGIGAGAGEGEACAAFSKLEDMTI